RLRLVRVISLFFLFFLLFFFSSRRRHTRSKRDWSSDVCSSDLKINFIGIRLDSGDIAYLSKEARRMLDEAGFEDAKIFASNDLDEETITSLKAQGAKVTAWG